ncbi:MAG: hypothetical protein ACRC6O_08725 [Flavobacterium sp.]
MRRALDGRVSTTSAATNLSGGVPNSVILQTAPSSTGFIPPGLRGARLTMGATTPQFTRPIAPVTTLLLTGFTYTTPPGCIYIHVKIYGGGGGGGGGVSGVLGGGAGGGAGETVAIWRNPGTYSYTLGLGGVGGSSVVSGQTGSATTFDGVAAAGGVGGTSGGIAAPRYAGRGGTPNANGMAGGGGSTDLGQGGKAFYFVTATVLVGENGQAPGGGGGGAAGIQFGGNAAGGGVLITEFY